MLITSPRSQTRSSSPSGHRLQPVSSSCTWTEWTMSPDHKQTTAGLKQEVVLTAACLCGRPASSPRPPPGCPSRTAEHSETLARCSLEWWNYNTQQSSSLVHSGCFRAGWPSVATVLLMCWQSEARWDPMINLWESPWFFSSITFKWHFILTF